MTVDKQQQVQQRRRVDDTSTKPLENPFVTGDQVWCVFYRNAANGENVLIKPAAQPTTVHAVATKIVSLRRSCYVSGVISKG